MSISVTSVKVLNNPCKFTDPFAFEICVNCQTTLEDDLEWKLIYVGSADSEKYDQELENVFVGPLSIGINQFTFQAPAPDYSKIPVSDILGATVIMLSCSYMGHEYTRIGYYVNNEYTTEELRENPPAVPQVELIQRNILDENPRITLYSLDSNAKPSSASSSSSSTTEETTETPQQTGSTSEMKVEN